MQYKVDGTVCLLCFALFVLFTLVTVYLFFVIISSFGLVANYVEFPQCIRTVESGALFGR
jgi:hypothetical protein